MSLLTVASLGVRRGNRAVLSDVSFSLAPGEVVGLIGPNGAGKTTLMRAALGLLAHTGRSSLSAMPPRDRARRAAWLPQTREIAWPVSVAALVALGRTPYRAPGLPLNEADRAAVSRALARTDLAALAERKATELSGGEQARALLARALAQETPLLLADEPTAGLDPAHQIAAMETFAALGAEGRGIVVALHDLGLAARHCTRLLLLDQGRLAADGPPTDVLTAERLGAVFGIAGRFVPADSGPIFQTLGRIHA